MPESLERVASIAANGAFGNREIKTSSMSKKSPMAVFVNSLTINHHPRLKRVFLKAVSLKG